MKAYRNPETVHAPIASYTHQIEIQGPERLLVISGQVGRTIEGVVPEDPLEQLDLALENLMRNLHAAQMDVRDLVKLTFYLVGEMDAAQRREILAAHLKGHQPCTTLLYVVALASPAYKVELDAWASKEDMI